MSVLRETAMADDTSRSRLGRGLASLIGDMGAESNTAVDRARGQRRVPIEHIRANAKNPRKNFSDAELDELANSVRERGIIQPIIVRQIRGSEDFEIIAGERRWRAAQRAALHDMPVVVVEANDNEVLQMAIIENVQRADLNAMEEAAGYQSLADQFDYSQDDIARIVGKSRSHVANTMRLLKLSEPVQTMVRAGKLSAGHARILIGQPNAVDFAQDIIARSLNVRQVEELARENPDRIDRKPRVALKKDADTVALEKRVSDVLGLTVSVDHHGDSGGTVHIKYRDLDQLDEIMKRLARGN
ncbi:MAG: ParB/RepB/Spo0J family partition protein [Xanthobacteraceae bacterium]